MTYLFRKERILGTLHKKCAYLELFGCIFSRIWTEYVEILRILRIQSKCGKRWTRITPNIDTFYTVDMSERIRALYANKDRYSYICVAFRELRSQNQPVKEKTQKYIQNNHIWRNHAYFLGPRKLYKKIKFQKEIQLCKETYRNC